MKHSVSRAIFSLIFSTVPWVAAPALAAPCDIAGGPAVSGVGLAQLLAHWTGAASYAPCPPISSYDFNGDCRVNGLDLASYLAAWGTSCEPTVTQLAGNALSSYPYFEYVRAFNQGAGFHVAIDPARFPAIVGKTCDIYVTDHGLSIGATLTDVTTGGFQTETFVAGPIQANTFLISGSAALNGTAGAQIGVGYDVVFDCNQNGALDHADDVDGLGAEAGLYVVRDTTAPGPYQPITSPGYVVTGITDLSNSKQQTFYPANIADLGQLPLIVISPRSGSNYMWYSHIGNHMASYGYLVMSHQLNDAPGVSTAAVSTIQHTNAIIGQQATILGGVLNGHIDASKIVWVGYSRGGEGVVIAYDHLFDGTPLAGGPYTPVGWSVDSIKLISSMAPVDFLGPTSSNPHGVAYHVWTAGGDASASGCASSDIAEWYHLHDRAAGYRQSTAIYGAGHGDFHVHGGSFTGPCPIGVSAASQIIRGYLLPLINRYVEDDLPSKDFLWRQWERFKPIGAPTSGACAPPSGTGEAIVVNLMYRDGPAAGNFVIDDFQSNPEPAVSSSGGAITFAVTNLEEKRLDDGNSDFTWTVADPMNGMTLARSTDTSAGVVFDWSAPAFFEEQILPGQQDFRPFAYLSFRAAQGTRHPHTIAALEDVTFDVVLRDATGGISRINIGAFGGGVEEPYQRTGCGPGVGWNNEFETIRIRLTDFLNNGSRLDLRHIVAVRFEFAAPGTSPVGRMGLDEIELTRD